MNEEMAKRLALGMAILCVRNTCIEDLHAGIEPSSQAGDFSDVKVVTPYGEIPWNKLSRIRGTVLAASSGQPQRAEISSTSTYFGCGPLTDIEVVSADVRAVFLHKAM
jgi:hypothetical protein